MSLKGKNYWKHVVLEIEKAAAAKTRREIIKDNDYSVTLPAELRRRVAKIMPYEFADYDRNVFGEELIDLKILKTNFDVDEETSSESTEVIEDHTKQKKVEFNESTCSEIEGLEHEFVRFDLKLDTPIEHKLKAKKKVNWCSKFLCKKRKERVKWESKIYKMETNMLEKTLDEQAEVLMEATAERFSEWVNSLGTNQDSNISKEKLINLFSIEGDRNLLASIQTEPKEVNAIAKTVADKWNIPEMALELKYENYIKDRLKNLPKKVLTVAFGRTIPYFMRPWVPTAGDDRIKTVFPDEILSGQQLFKGIQHLRSTKALIEFYRNHPNIKKPRYMNVQGMFKVKQESAAKGDIPLYEKLKLQF